MLKDKQNIGKFDCQVTLLKPVFGPTTSKGQNITGYEEFDSDSMPYVRWVNKLGNNTIEADQILHVQQAIVSMRYREDIKLNCKIVKDSKMYAIHSFAESGETRKRFLDLTVEYEKEYVIT
jgi:head-tail adaptor